MKNKLEQQVNTSVEVSLRLLFLFILIGVCLTILAPFLSPVLWGIIIAVSVAPIYDRMTTRFKSSWAATLIVLVMLAVIIVPSWIMVSSLTDSVHDVIENYQDGKLDIPPPSEKVAELPFVGKDVYEMWQLASENLEEAIIKYDKPLTEFGTWLLNTISGLAGEVFLFIFSIIIAGVLLATKGTKDFNKRLFIKVVGQRRGAEFAEMAEQTIRSVTKGILGVAIIQSIAMSIILSFAGVPYAGIWALLVLIMAIIQIPVTLMTIPIIAWLYSNVSPGMATLWTVLIILGSLIDNVLKPILLGKGAPVPMVVIFLGAIGGFVSMGFIGLFTGAIVLSVGYRLLIAWIEDTGEEDSKTELATQEADG